MAFLADNIAEFTVKGKASGQDILNVVHYRVANPGAFPPGGLDISAVLDDFITAWRLACLPGVSNTYTVESYLVQALVSTSTNPGPPPFTQIDIGDQFLLAGVPAIDVGALTADPMPSFNAVGVRKFSDRAGRNFRGGLRIGPITDIQADGNQLTAPTVIGFADRWTTFHETNLPFPTLEELEPAVFSRTLALSRPVPNITLRVDSARWVASLINSFVTSQVSRKQSLTRTT